MNHARSNLLNGSPRIKMNTIYKVKFSVVRKMLSRTDRRVGDGGKNKKVTGGVRASPVTDDAFYAF